MNLKKNEGTHEVDFGNVLNMNNITPNLKRWDYRDIPGGDT